MDSTTADKIDKLYKNYEILSEAKDKISEVSISPIHSSKYTICICVVKCVFY